MRRPDPGDRKYLPETGAHGHFPPQRSCTTNGQLSQERGVASTFELPPGPLKRFREFRILDHGNSSVL